MGESLQYFTVNCGGGLFSVQAGNRVQNMTDSGGVLVTVHKRQNINAKHVCDRIAQALNDEARLRKQRDGLESIVRMFRIYHSDGIGQLTHIMTRADAALAGCGDNP